MATDVAAPPTEREQLKRHTVEFAVNQGLRAGGIAAALSSVGVYAGHQYWPKFRHGLGISGKLGLIMCTITGTYFLTAEKALIDAQRHPEAYGLSSNQTVPNSMEATAQAATTPSHGAKSTGVTMSLRHHFAGVANFLYDHPFWMVGGLSVPIIGGLYATEMQKPEMTLQRAILHTRVQGQMSVVGILAVTMGFREWMQRNGGRMEDE